MFHCEPGVQGLPLAAGPCQELKKWPLKTARGKVEKICLFLEQKILTAILLTW
jgi:hypothetical protein